MRIFLSEKFKDGCIVNFLLRVIKSSFLRYFVFSTTLGFYFLALHQSSLYELRPTGEGDRREPSGKAPLSQISSISYNSFADAMIVHTSIVPAEYD